LSYKPLVGKDDFEEVFINSSQNVSSENFRVLILITNDTFRLGMILPKKNIKLAVNRNYLKRIIRNFSIDVFAESKVSLVVVSKKRILNFKKDKLRREIKTLFLNLIKKLNEKNNCIFN
jgi:ribonuclease P protein component